MEMEKMTKGQLISELVKLRQRIAELEKSEAECKLAEEALRESEKELREKTKALEEANIALRVILSHRDEIQKRLEHTTHRSLQKLVTP
jgi:hypothetical protein